MRRWQFCVLAGIGFGIMSHLSSGWVSVAEMALFAVFQMLGAWLIWRHPND